jgi:hypothetical protein
MIHIKKVINNKDRMEFIRFPWKVYNGNPNWVSPLIREMKKLFYPSLKHPFYEYGEMQLFLAFSDGETVGRIAAIKNDLYTKYHNDRLGFFGFFECVDDQKVANELFESAKNWLKGFGFKKMNGPASPSSNYDYGMLSDGFNDPPKIMMTYNPPYYLKLFENYGFCVSKELFAYKLETEKVLENKKLFRFAELAKRRSGLEISTINMKKLKREVQKVKEIYNKAWKPNYGHVPFTDAEIDLLANDLKPIADPELIFFGHINGELAGMAIAVPDFNFVIKQMNGKLFPFNFLKIFTQKKKIKWLRVLVLGIIPKFQRRGLDAVFYSELVKAAQKKNYKFAEAGWILEDNQMMRRGMEVVNGEIYKRYLIYDKEI